MKEIYVFNLLTSIHVFHFQAIRENWNLKYSATYILCLLRKTGVKPEETVGASVSVVSPNLVDKPPSNILTVVDTEPKQGIQVNVSIFTVLLSYATMTIWSKLR